MPPIDPELLARYDVAAPRYTSYPTAVQFHPGFDETDYVRAVGRSNQGLAPLSLYIHIPFCQSLCYYCACSKVITRHPEKAEAYLDYLLRELKLQAARFQRRRPLRQLHLGGGTPTFLTDEQLARLMHAVREAFTLAPAGEREFSIEVDPRAVGPDTIARLGQLGFTRMSLGVQDFDPRVQQAVNRIQPAELVARVVDDARSAGFRSLGFDLIYGLPYQTTASFRDTLDQVIALAPDQLSVYNYAHLPERMRAQRLIAADTLPTPPAKLEILTDTIARLGEAGYRHIGMDHFARPESELARALDAGTLQRNFQGYSTHAECDLIGLGVTAIGSIADTYSQNAARLPSYYAAIDAGRIPVARGIRLNADDRLRRAAIQALMCRAELRFASLDAEFGGDSRHRFEPELRRLQPLAEDGLVTITPATIEVTALGRLLLRNIARVFDRYLAEAGEAAPRFSRAV